MGWAKYAEDNLEIILDRQFMRGAWKHGIPRHPSYTGNSFTPLSAEAYPGTDRPTNNVCEAESFTDRYIQCRDCGRPFLFSVKSQKSFSKKGWNPPKRCEKCRNYRNTLHLMHSWR